MKLPVYQISLFLGIKLNECELNLLDFIPAEIRNKTSENIDIPSKTNGLISVYRSNILCTPEQSDEPKLEGKMDGFFVQRITIPDKHKNKIPNNLPYMIKGITLFWSPYEYQTNRKEFIQTMESIIENTKETKRRSFDLNVYPDESTNGGSFLC